MIDEKKGRIAARKFGIPVTGALGVLATAFRQGSIFSASEEIMRLKTEAGFFVSDEVVDRILEIAGER